MIDVIQQKIFAFPFGQISIFSRQYSYLVILIFPFGGSLDNMYRHIISAEQPGPIFCLLLGVSSDYAQPITGQVTEVTCPVIGQAQPELTPSKRQKTGPDVLPGCCCCYKDAIHKSLPDGIMSSSVWCYLFCPLKCVIL